MLMRLLAKWLMQGRLQAIIIVASLALLFLALPPLSLLRPIFAVLSAAAVSLVTLRKGPREGLLLIAVAIITVMAVAEAMQGMAAIAVSFALVFWLPIYLVSMVLRSTVSLARSFEFLVFLGVVGIAILYAGIGDPITLWREQLTLHVLPLLQKGEVDTAGWDPQQLLEILSSVMTGFLAASTMLGLFLSLVLARWWQSQLYNPAGFGAEFRAMRLHKALAYVVLAIIAGLLLGIVPGFIADSLPLMAVAFIIQGLAVLHGLAWSRKVNPLWLVALYLALLLTFPLAFYLFLALILLGYTDSWLDFRSRMGGNRIA